MNNLKNNILNKIKSGEVDMKPYWHFVLKSLLLILGIIVTALLVIYILSFIQFFLRQSGIGFMPLYGFRGLIVFVMNSPWLLIVSAGALIAVILLLVRKYSFSFKQPLLYSLIGIIILVLFGTYAIGQIQLHPHLHGLVEKHRVPVFGPLYRGIDERRPESITFGTITKMSNNGFVLESDTGEVIVIEKSQDTKQPPHKTFTVNETVIVFGDRDGDTITAIGIRPAPPTFEIDRLNDIGPRNNIQPNWLPPKYR